MAQALSVQKFFFVAFCLEAYRLGAMRRPVEEAVPDQTKTDALNLLHLVEALCSGGAGFRISLRRVKEFRTRLREGISNGVFSSQAFVLREILHEELRDYGATVKRAR